MIQRPFLKWAGGKAKQAERIRAALPPGRVLVEPFVGAGSVFMNTEFEHYVLNDINPDLINTFSQLRVDPAGFIEQLREYFTPEQNTDKAFRSLRDRFNTTTDLVDKALLFVYLNRHCFNGLCRYNRSGEFNVAFGKYQAPMFPGDELKAFAQKLQRAELFCLPFQEIFANLSSDSVVYCDPPFIPLSATASFTSYAADGFPFTQQELLASLAGSSPVPVLVSNHDTPVTRNLYAKAQISSSDVQRSISQNGATRGKAKELLALFPAFQSANHETIRQLINEHHTRVLAGKGSRRKSAKSKPTSTEQQFDLLFSSEPEADEPVEFGSLCSGIEAASVAWETLGWKAAWFSEIDPFASAVLAHHWPDVENLGDMTTIRERVKRGEVKAPPVVVGGTPCQAFSIAGLRESLADDRGQLTLEYVRLADDIDAKRTEAGDEPAVFVWENVPGVFSSRDNAFGCLLAGLAGDTGIITPGNKPADGKSSKHWVWSKKNSVHFPKWPVAGCIVGPQRTVSWRMLDAQYFGVAQRRRRVFVVASARNGFDPTQVLFEFEGVRRDSPPSREAGKAVAALTANGIGVGGPDDNQGLAGHLLPVAGTLNASMGKGKNGQDISCLVPDVAITLTASMAKNSGIPAGNDCIPKNLICMAHGQGGAEISENGCAPTLTCNHEAPIACYDLKPVCVTGDVTHTLKAEGFDGSEDGTGRGQPIVATLSVHGTQDPIVAANMAHCLGRNSGQENVVLAFSAKDHGGDATENLSPTLRAGNSHHGNANSGNWMAVMIAPGSCGGNAVFTDTYNGSITGDVAAKLSTQSGDGVSSGPTVLANMKVRRLTPVECERLQGLPDNHTNVPYRNKPAADGPRYKAIGNSMAVPVMRWIGQRIQQQIAQPKFRYKMEAQ